MIPDRTRGLPVWRAPMEEYPELLLDKSMQLLQWVRLGVLTGVAVLSLVMLAAPLQPGWRGVVAAGLAGLAVADALVLYLAGPLAAARLFIGAGWLLVTAACACGPGLQGAQLSAYPLLILLSGWMLGGGYCVALFLLSCVAVDAMAAAQAAGQLGGVRLHATEVSMNAAGLLVVMSVTTLVTLYLVRVFCARYGELRALNGRSQLDLQAAQASEADFRLLAEHIPGLVFQCDGQGRCVYANQRLARFLGRPKQSLLGTPMVDLMGGGAMRDLMVYQRAALRGKVVEFEMRRLAADGKWCNVEVTLMPRRAPDSSRVIGWYGMIYDVTRRESMVMELREKATHDPLTGLPNRLLFHERLKHGLAGAYRNKKSVAVMFVDLDNFKRVNDEMGHAAGDVFLQEIARRLNGAVRAADTVARLGGDEFVVMAEEIESPEAAAVIADKVLGSLMQPVLIGKASVASGASIGIALGPQDGDTGEALLQAADAALYEAKAAGRKCYRLFSDSMMNSAPETGGFSRSASLE